MDHNLGCGGGRRLGSQLADTDLVFFLDDDAELLPGALDHLVAELDAHPHAGAVTATVLHPDGKVFHSGGPVKVSDEEVTFSLLGDGTPLSEQTLPPSGPSGWVPGTAFLARRSLLRESPVDDAMGAYFEDNEWCYRVSRNRPNVFRRSREALVVHHSRGKPPPSPDFASRSATSELLASYARFYSLHGRLLGPWLFDHVSDLRAADGSCDLRSARVLMELVLAKGTDWVLMEWMNGDLGSLLTGNRTLVDARAAEQAAEQKARHFSQALEVERAEVARLRARAAHDAHTISSLEDVARKYARVEASVTWQLFQRTRGRVFGLLGGEDSLGAEAIQATLRYFGRRVRHRSVNGQGAIRSGMGRLSTIRLPEYEHPEVSILIPLYSGADLTRAALESIRDNTQHVSYEVILVDDSEDEDTKALLRQVRGARQIVNEENLGYLRSVNKGAAAARGRWLVLCNNDIEVQPGWLAAMIDCAMSQPDVAIVAPKFVYPNGKVAEAGGVIWRDATGANYGRGDEPTHCHYEYRREIDYGSAAALMVRVDFWNKVGGFDERFLPMYYEDTDLCFEARARGLRVMYEPASHVIHVEGGTAGVDITAGHKRHQEANRPKFVEKWRERLEAEHLPNDQRSAWRAANLRRTPHVLVVDYRVPMWDRESGALRMRGILETLTRLGCHVTFLPDNLNPVQPYTRELQRLGVEVLYGIEIPDDIEKICAGLSLVILSRPPVASRWLELVREHASAATVVYDTVDLHWLREARRVALLNGLGKIDDFESLPPKATAMRELELALVRATDKTLVVTEAEREQVLADVPDAEVLVVPNVNELRALSADFDQREGVLFVGGFQHPPNVDAALILVRDVMPMVWAALGAVQVAIVGSDAPPEVQALASAQVKIMGWVPDLDPLLDASRVMAAPLTYGAGLKGKVTQSLAAGLPVVTTPVGAEGLDAADGEQLLIGTEPRELAARIIRALTEPELWRKLSRAGQQLAAERCSPLVLNERLTQLLDQIPAAPTGLDAARSA